MKKIWFIMILISFAACQKEELSNKSIFSDEQAVKTDFDRWLDRNYVDPYNIRFEYRMPDNETGFSYWVTPPDVEKSIKVAKVVKHLSLECMVEMMADDNPDRDPALFVKKYFPRVLFLVGCYHISNTGSVALASAENGLQINILGVNFFDDPVVDGLQISGTMVHEFMHILHAAAQVPVEFHSITESKYVGSTYTNLGGDYHQHGFVNNYARSSIGEDVAVTGAALICETDATWEKWYAAGGEEGGAILRKKHDLLKKWLYDSFGVDSDRWREVYLRRVGEINDIDWTNLED
jgi:substrate import-associated zinc metallohydrolase lipoprotein